MLVQIRGMAIRISIKLGEAARTVQAGALIEAERHGRHGSHVHDHVIAYGLPDHSYYNADHDQFCVLPQHLHVSPAKKDSRVLSMPFSGL